MQRRFSIASETDLPETLSKHSPLVGRLLRNRGIESQEAAERFLAPDYDAHMNDPFLMHDMEKAVERIHAAIQQKEKIVVYADYDCDGIPGAVILNDFFAKIGCENYSIYIPDRHDEGYGLNKEAIEQFTKDGVKLIITIDLGTSDHEDIALAQQNGIDVIVTDHHLPHETLPDAFAIVNPKIGDTYPDPMLCGSGVAFKLVQAFLSKHGEEYGVPVGWEKWLLDMAGLATLSDMVPLSGENRVIASFGMRVFRKSPRPGLAQLLRLLKIEQQYITEDDITFMVTPRINAASRMDSPMRAFELLSERDPAKAGALALHLSSINDERKRLVAQIMKEAKHTLSERTIGDIIVIGNPSWRVGVLGLVASKIMEEYDRPAFVWGREGSSAESGGVSLVKGSCRSNGAVNVVRLMETAREHFTDFGGHELAGGFSVSMDAVHYLEERLAEAYAVARGENGPDAAMTHGMIDTALSLGDVTDTTTTMLAKLSPFGLGNQKPLFRFPNLTVKSVRMFGKEKNHLELAVTDALGTERTAMAFFADADTFTKPVAPGAAVDLVANIEKSYFLGRAQIRLRIVDIL